MFVNRLSSLGSKRILLSRAKECITWHLQFIVRDFCYSVTYSQDWDSHDNVSLFQKLCEQGQLDRAFHVLSLRNGDPPSKLCMAFLKACIKRRSLDHTRKMHTFLTQDKDLVKGLLGDYLVLAMAKCGAVDDALKIAVALPERSVFSWTAIISGYAEKGLGYEAFKMHQSMLEDGVTPNVYTFVSLCKACGSMSDLQQGMWLHADGCMKGFTDDAYVSNTLVSMYGKCGAIMDAEKIFNSMPHHNIVSWTAMLSAYAEQGCAEKVLQLYRQMLEDGIISDLLTLGIVLDACSTLAEKNSYSDTLKLMLLDIGRCLHSDARRKGYMVDTMLCNTLLTMYAKCGKIQEAENVFTSMVNPDVISWTAILAGYTEHNQPEKALSLYQQMQKHWICSNDVTIISVLQACGATCNLDVSRQLHFSVVSSAYDQVPLVITTLVYAYGSCGDMINAEPAFDSLPDPDVVCWTAFIDGHASMGNAFSSLQSYAELIMGDMKPCSLTFTAVLLGCSHDGLVSEGLYLFTLMESFYSISPDTKQYGIMADLLGRTGNFKGATNILHKMPMNAGPSICLSLLRACHTHGNSEIADQAFNLAVQLHPKQPSTYILMSNVYANIGKNE